MAFLVEKKNNLKTNNKNDLGTKCPLNFKLGFSPIAFSFLTHSDTMTPFDAPEKQAF